VSKYNTAKLIWFCHSQQEQSVSKPIILVNFSVPPDVAPEFTAFFQHEFLPVMMRESPQLTNVRRYEEFGVGASLRWYNKQYLTIYQLADDEAVARADSIFENAAVESVMKRFREWNEKCLRNFSRITFVPTWAHNRRTTDDFSGPFFMWQLEMKSELDAAFQQWYQDDYLPLQIADIPTWSGCRRYTSHASDQIRHLTIFETADEPALARSVEDLRASHRIQANYEWQRRVEHAVIWQDATSFRPIMRLPD
jgi:hypothetical protein